MSPKSALAFCLGALLLELVFVLFFGLPPPSGLKITVIKKRTGALEAELTLANVIPVVNVGPSTRSDGQGFLVAGSPFHACSKLDSNHESNAITHLIISFYEGGCHLEQKLQRADAARYSIVLLVNERGQHPPPPAWRLELKNYKFKFVTHAAVISLDEADLLSRYVYPDAVRFFLSGSQVVRPTSSPFIRWYGFTLHRKGTRLKMWAQIYSQLLALFGLLKFSTWLFSSTFHGKKAKEIQLTCEPSTERRTAAENERPTEPRSKTVPERRETVPSAPASEEVDPSLLVEVQGKQYVREELIGRGGFGKVWRVRERGSVPRRRYALKEIELPVDGNDVEGGGVQEIAELLVGASGSDSEPREPSGAEELARVRAPIRALQQFVHEVMRDYRKHQAAGLRESLEGEIDILTMLTNSSCSKYIVQKVESEETPPETVLQGNASRVGCILMECGGQNILDKIVSDGGQLTHGGLAQLWRQMRDAVGCLHSYGVVHLDLKPSNFVWFEYRLKLVDFGTAWAFDALAKNAMAKEPIGIGGTPGFMAPEVLLGKLNRISPAADVWSLGCILYSLLTRMTPLTEELAALGDANERTRWLERLQVEDFERKVTVGVFDYNRVLGACLRVLPERRPKVGDDYMLDLRPVNTATTNSNRGPPRAFTTTWAEDPVTILSFR